MKELDLMMFEQHVNEFEFKNGEDLGMWGIHTDDLTNSWPFLLIWIQTSEVYITGKKIYLKFTLDNYPESPPSARPWDVEEDTPLPTDQWPKGSVALESVFKPGWNVNGLYTPFDRVAIPGHDIWKQQFPQYWWNSSRTITEYLLFLHSLLNT